MSEAAPHWRATKRTTVDNPTPAPPKDRPKLRAQWEFDDPILRARRRQMRRWLARLIVLVSLSTIVTVWVASGADERALRREYDATVEADLARLAEVQDAYLEANGRYGSLDELGMRYISSQGVRVRILAADEQGWSATGWHLLTSRTCTITSGAGPATLPGHPPDVPDCS